MNLYSLRYQELESRMHAEGVNPVHARDLWKALYRDLPRSVLAPPLKNWLERQVGPTGWSLPPVVEEQASNDGLTQKFLLGLSDREKIETVLMGYPGRFTACLSTQVGCAMGCVFCATGQMGFVRHLQPAEIVSQVLVARAKLPEATRGEQLRNLVLMGMGEPLHNYEAVMTALEIITDTRGINIGPSRITISTVGVVPGIRRMAEERRPYNLAVSLHGAEEVDRAALVPISRKWPLVELMEACRFYGEATGRRIFFEWTLIAGVNDTPAHATKLAEVLQGIDAHLNLIPLNLTSGYGGQPTDLTQADEFQEIIHQAGFPCTVRQRRGLDVAAGCGQLRQAEKI
jgi:23S rRNA (adenine2503-C2)-methyltransferase